MWYREAIWGQQPLTVAPLKNPYKNVENINDAINPPEEAPVEQALDGKATTEQTQEAALSLARTNKTKLGQPEPDFNIQIAPTELNQSNSPAQMFNAGRGVSKSFSQQGYFPPDNWDSSKKWNW